MSSGQWRVLGLLMLLLFMEVIRGGAVKGFFSEIFRGLRASTGG
jgi:hypothetical protein